VLLKNTSRYDTKLVRQIIKFAAGNIPIDDVAINIKNSQHVWAGRAFASVPWESPWRGQASRLIVCRIGGPQKFPYQTHGYPGRKVENGNWPTPLLGDWMEALVFLVAHELFHIVQFRVKARASEIETEAYGMKRMLAWRELVAKGGVHVPVALPKPVVERSVAKKQAMTAKLEHARKMLQKNLTKLKRAETIAKKWRTKVRYYERSIAKHHDLSSRHGHVVSTSSNSSELGLGAHQ
jgi:hypothetical protein